MMQPIAGGAGGAAGQSYVPMGGVGGAGAAGAVAPVNNGSTESAGCSVASDSRSAAGMFFPMFIALAFELCRARRARSERSSQRVG